jgi:hypothetical protein
MPRWTAGVVTSNVPFSWYSAFTGSALPKRTHRLEDFSKPSPRITHLVPPAALPLAGRISLHTGNTLAESEASVELCRYCVCEKISMVDDTARMEEIA